MKIILAITILYVIPFIVVYLNIRKEEGKAGLIDAVFTITPLFNLITTFLIIKGTNWNFNWFFFKKP